jgi:cell division protein FtsB
VSSQEPRTAPLKEVPEKGVSPVYHTALAVAVLLLLAVISKLFIEGYMEIARLEAKREGEKKRKQEYTATLSKMESEIRLLKTDEGVEMVARDKLRFIRPDEVVIMPLK